MKKFLIGLALLLSVSALSAQATKDSVLQSDRIGRVHDGIFEQGDLKSVITFTHHNTIPTHVVIKKVDNKDSSGMSIAVGNFKNTYTDEEGNVYFYYDAVMENSKENGIFAVRYEADGSKFDSIGFIRSDHTIIVFFITKNESL
jgi:hypothetical protein